MYTLNNIIVSENHLVKYNNIWIRVNVHPYAKEITYNKPFLYCLNTSNKVIELNGITFSDWDEIVNDKLSILYKQNQNIKILENVHEYLDDGFEENTYIDINKTKIKINKIKIGDILDNGSIVYGLIEIDTGKLRKYNKNNKQINRLYHLLTTDGNLQINSENVKDYNNLIDKFII
jgi:hypothetical protein